MNGCLKKEDLQAFAPRVLQASGKGGGNSYVVRSPIVFPLPVS